jgi:hypothetical protein
MDRSPRTGRDLETGPGERVGVVAEGEGPLSRVPASRGARGGCRGITEGFLTAARRCNLEGKGGGNLPPPFESLAQGGIAPTHVLEVAGGIGRIGERGNDVGDDEPPRLAVPGTADLFLLKENEFAHGDQFGFGRGKFQQVCGQAFAEPPRIAIARLTAESARPTVASSQEAGMARTAPRSAR